MSCRIGRVAAGMRWGDTAGRSRRRRPMARPAPRRRDDDDEGERERKLLAWIWEWIDSILIHGKGMGLINKQTRAKANGGEEEEGKGISSAATRPDAMGSYMGHGPQSRPSGPA